MNKIENNEILIRSRFPIYNGLSIISLAGFTIYLILFSILNDEFLAIGICAFAVYLLSMFIFYDAILSRKKLAYYYPTRIFNKKVEFNNIEITEIRFTNGGPRGIPYFVIHFQFNETKMKKTISISGITSVDFRKKIIGNLRENNIKVVEV